MTRTEALQFLELNDFASDEEVAARLAEKLQYFTQLRHNAPNDFLRKLYGDNLLKIEAIRREWGIRDVAAPPPGTPPRTKAAAPEERYNAGPAAVAWLVRHTEDRPTKSYPLLRGKNFLGRSPRQGGHAIVVDDDPYVSKDHAVIEVSADPPHRMILADDQAANQGKPSRNGTYINGSTSRLTKATEINLNDTIQIGYTKFVIRPNNAPLPKLMREVEESEFVKTVVINIF